VLDGLDGDLAAFDDNGANLNARDLTFTCYSIRSGACQTVSVSWERGSDRLHPKAALHDIPADER
jgi:hypothetical protein